MPNWNKHYVVDIAVLLALTFLTTIYSHPLLPTCHPEQRRRIPWKGTLWKIDCVQQYTTDVHNVSVPGDVSTALRSAQHDRQRRFSMFVFNVCSLLIVIGFAMHIVISRLPTLRTNRQNRFHRRCCTFGRRSRILLQL